MVKTKQNQKSLSFNLITYEYDDLYRLKKKDFSSGTDTEYENDAAGRLTKMKDASGEKRYTYDDADRMTKILQGPQGFVDGTDQNYKIEYTWNAASQKTETKLTVRTLSAKTWTFTFTDDGQLDTEVNPDSETTDHDYLTDGRLKKITLRKTGGGNGPTREYFYLDTNDSHAYVASKCKFLRKTLDKKAAGTSICSATYELDKGGRQLSDTNQDSLYKAFGLDPNSNTRAENMWQTKTSSTRDYQFLFAFDGNGNRLTKFEDGTLTAYTYGDSNELTAAGSDTFTYDIFLNVATKVSGGNTTTYGWDKESNLLLIDFPSTANDDTHEYDGAARRMRSKLAGAANWTHFIWDEVAGTLLAEYTLISGTFTITAENTWGLGLISTNRAGTKRYFHFDGPGNTVALTDSSENITDTYGYTASGVVVSVQDSGTSVNPFRWQGNGGAYDDGAMGSSSGLVFVRNTPYSAVLGKFILQNTYSRQRDCDIEYLECMLKARKAYDECMAEAASHSKLCLFCGLLVNPVHALACYLLCSTLLTDVETSHCDLLLHGSEFDCRRKRERCKRSDIQNWCYDTCYFECLVVQENPNWYCIQACGTLCTLVFF